MLPRTTAIRRSTWAAMLAKPMHFAWSQRLLPLLLALVLTSEAYSAEYTYTTNTDVITITKYIGPGGDVLIPDTLDGWPVTSLGDFAFMLCATVTNVTVPASVTNLGYGVFAICENLTNIAVDAANPAFVSVGGVLFNRSGGTLIQCPGGLAGTYHVPDPVTNLASFSFEGCTSLTNVLIPDSVESIGQKAFYGDYALSSVRIGNRVKAIETATFYRCTALRSIVIPDSVTLVDFDAFMWCGNLKTADIGHGVWAIASRAFYYCTNLESVVLGDGLRNIGTEAFYRCTNLANVRFGVNVTNIGSSAFYRCMPLRSITLPNTLLTLGENAFYSCVSMTSAYFQGNAPSLGGSVGPFVGDNNLTAYYLPGTTGWTATLGGRPTVLWNPTIRTTGTWFGVDHLGAFGFLIEGSSNLVVVVEGSTNLSGGTWQAISTNTLTRGSSYFSDRTYSTVVSRHYRLRSP